MAITLNKLYRINSMILVKHVQYIERATAIKFNISYIESKMWNWIAETICTTVREICIWWCNKQQYHAWSELIQFSVNLNNYWYANLRRSNSYKRSVNLVNDKRMYNLMDVTCLLAIETTFGTYSAIIIT